MACARQALERTASTKGCVSNVVTVVTQVQCTVSNKWRTLHFFVQLLDDHLSGKNLNNKHNSEVDPTSFTFTSSSPFFLYLFFLLSASHLSPEDLTLYGAHEDS